ncbi:EAL domain-containing protein [Luteimonas sp. R10]|nr:EAL domain-containing protein [Luteimonas sp. R10]
MNGTRQSPPATAPVHGPAMLVELLGGLLPAGSELAVCWRDPRLGCGSAATGTAGAALLARAVEGLAGAAADGPARTADLSWEQGDTRVFVAVDPADGSSAPAWRRLATRMIGAVMQSELSHAQVRSLQKSERLQQALYEIADLSGSSLEMREMLARIHRVVAALMSAENFYIVLHDEARETIRFLYFADQNDPWRPEPERDLALGDMPNSITVALLRHGRPMMGPSARIRDELGVPRDPVHGPDSADWLGVPMRRDSRVCGAIVVQNYDRADSYSQEDRALLEYVAQHILTALDRKHAQAELERRVDERTLELQHANRVLQAEVEERQRTERLQRALFRISEMSVTAGSLDRFYADVHEVVGGLLYAANFYIAMVGADGEHIEFPYSVDERDPVRRPRRMTRGLTEFVITSGRPLLVDREAIARLEAEGGVHSHGARANCWLGVPLVRDGSVIGAIAVQSYSDGTAFDERDEALLTFVAHHIGGALSRKRAQESLKTAHAELEFRVEARTQELKDANRQLRAQIGERMRAEQRLIHQARHDQLTGLPNREHLLEKLDASIARMHEPGTARFAVLFLDLDRFKLVNDSVGHAAGDDMLVEIGRRVRHALAVKDTVARLGGDEFAILLEDVATPELAQAVASRVLAELSKPMWIAGRELFPSASIGIAVWQPRYRYGEELLRDADAAMYRAKARGRDRSALFDEAMRAEATRLLDLEADLRRAIMHDAFEPHFQPIVRLSDGEVIGHEALLRWNHELRGSLPPADFIGVGEDSGLIEQVDWLLYRRVVRWLRTCPRGYVSINVSPRHFHSDDFAERLLRMIDEAGADPSRLRIELTEVALLDDAPRVLRMLNILREHGVLALLDDFGTGFSALSYLHRFPIQSLKIDQSFVAGLVGETRTESLALVRAILALAGTLGIETIGEGVETEQQRQVLMQLGCQYGQGFLYGHPRPAG